MPGHATVSVPTKPKALPTGVRLSAKAEARVRKPRTRGAFHVLEAARRQLALLSVADRQGQARIYWLVELPGLTIQDARFIAFGSLASHALCDSFTELARGRTVSDACKLSIAQIESVLRDDPLTPSCDDIEETGSFLRELQDRAEAELPKLVILPRPAEAVVYQRKREADWSATDRAWFSRSYLKKIASIDEVAKRVLTDRFGHEVAHRTEALNDDFHVHVSFTGILPEQIPTAEQFIQDALGDIHPSLVIAAPDRNGQP